MLLLAAALFFAPHYEMTLHELILQPAFDRAGNLYYDSWNQPSATHTLVRLDPDGNQVYRVVAAPSGMQSQTLGPFVPDAAGNVYVLSESAPSGDPLQCLLTKLDPAGKLVYSLSLAWAICAPAQTGVELIALGPDGSVFIAGSTLAAVPQSGSLLQTTPGAYVPVSATMPNQLDAYVVKVDPKGAGVVYATYLDPAPKQGTGWTTARALAVDAQGNAYVVGTSEDPGFLTTPGAFQTGCTCSPTTPGIFAVKLNADGSRAVYSTLLPPEPFVHQAIGPNPVPPFLAVSVDDTGRATVAQVQEPDTFTVLPADAPMGVSMITLAADGVAATNSSSFTFPMRSRASVASDGQGNVLIAGPNAPAGVSATPGALTNGNSFAAIVRLSDGAVLYATRLPDGAVTTIVPDATGGFLLMGSSAPSVQFTRTQLTRFIAAQPGPPGIFGVSNSGGVQVSAGLAPGELVTIDGVGLGPSQGVAGQYGPDGSLPRQLGGTTVTFNGIAAPMLYASGQQINAIVPFAIHGGASVTVQVSAGGSSSAATLPQQDVDPEALRDYEPGALPGGYTGSHFFALNQDGTVNSQANPAKAGSTVTLFLSGGGLMTPAAVEGQVEAAGATLVSPVGASGEVAAPDGLSCCFHVTLGTPLVTSAPGLPAGLVEVILPVKASSNHQLVIFLGVGGANPQASTTGAVWVTTGN